VDYNEKYRGDEQMIGCWQKLALHTIRSTRYNVHCPQRLPPQQYTTMNRMMGTVVEIPSAISLSCSDQPKILLSSGKTRMTKSENDYDAPMTSVCCSQHLDDIPSKNNSFLFMNSLGYGVMTEDSILFVIYLLVQSGNLLLPKPCIVDLGSGDGMVLLTCSIAIELSLAIGIEILPSLHKAAVSNEKHYQKYSSLVPEGQTRFQWNCADFTDSKTYSGWCDQADLIFIHATVFEPNLMNQLNMICQSCRRNTCFCLVSKKLEPPDVFETIAELSLPMSWGYGNVFIQIKR
jgi:Histone methylation protein DOT1